MYSLFTRFQRRYQTRSHRGSRVWLTSGSAFPAFSVEGFCLRFGCVTVTLHPPGMASQQNHGQRPPRAARFGYLRYRHDFVYLSGRPAAEVEPSWWARVAECARKGNYAKPKRVTVKFRNETKTYWVVFLTNVGGDRRGGRSKGAGGEKGSKICRRLGTNGGQDRRNAFDVSWVF
ncbi:hypothetical protein M422DRAFT_23258 [Sphaerobolus stellatus SS14]|nr:hypothetical protein M422DRAFT_23258 [Sphaerobolus stellatus SS14]